MSKNIISIGIPYKTFVIFGEWFLNVLSVIAKDKTIHNIERKKKEKKERKIK